MVPMDISGCRERGWWRQPWECSGRQGIGAGRAEFTFGTPAIGDRTSGSKAELITDLDTAESGSSAENGAAAHLPITRP